MSKESVAVIRLTRNNIEIVSLCCDEVLATTKGQNMMEQKGLLLEEGKAKCGWCEKEIVFPKVALRIFALPENTTGGM